MGVAEHGNEYGKVLGHVSRTVYRHENGSGARYDRRTWNGKVRDYENGMMLGYENEMWLDTITEVKTK